MKLLIIGLLITTLTACFKQNPKFIFKFPNIKFGTRVVVINGFYEGQRGVVVDYSDNYSTDCPRGYKVKLDSKLSEKPQFICNGGLVKI